MPYFDPGIRTFFAELGRNNSRAWFTAHRDDYERLVRVPLERLAAEAGERYGRSHVTRPNRDLRFSADKSPYSTSGSLWAGETGAVYLSVDATAIAVGGGLYGPSRDQLARGRAAIDGRPLAAPGLRGILRELEVAGFNTAGEPLATAPRGVAKDHPEIELLRLRHYAALLTLPLDAELEAIRSAWQAIEPLIGWIREFVGPAESRS